MIRIKNSRFRQWIFIGLNGQNYYLFYFIIIKNFDSKLFETFLSNDFDHLNLYISIG